MCVLFLQCELVKESESIRPSIGSNRTIEANFSRKKVSTFFFEKFKDFKLNYYVQHKNFKITKYVSEDTILWGMINLVGFFCGTDDQKCFQRVLLGFVVWESEKLFLGVLTQIKIIFF